MSVTVANRDINALHPVAQKACRMFLAECKRQGVDIFITETYRSQERQKWLYAQGRTRPGQVVTWTLNSNHKSRLAWDVAVSPPKAMYDVATLNKAGAIGRRLGIEWGGDWKGTVDRPHFQVKTSWKAPIIVSEQVKELQRLLNKKGFNLNVDGIEGTLTINAVKSFQKQVGLIVDGIAGAKTLLALRKPKEKEVDSLTKFMDEKLPLTQQKDAAELFKWAYKENYFSVDHSEKVKSMTRRQYYDLKESLETREKLNKKVK